MDRESLDTWCERGILGLVLAILVIGPAAGGGVHTPPFLVLLGLTVCVILVWAVRLWAAPRPRFLWPPLSWVVLVFTGYMIGRYLAADIEYVARQELIRVLIYAFLFLAIVNNLHRQDSVQIISFTLIFLAMAISMYAIYQFITGSNAVWHMVATVGHRGTGTYFSANNLAGFLEMVMPLGLAYAIAGRMKPVTRIFITYATFVVLVGIVVTVSRGAWIATGLALVIFFSLLLSERKYRLGAIAALVVLLGLGIWGVPRSVATHERIRNMVSEEGKVDDSLRYALWEPAYRLWQDSPWWGVGPGHFNERFRAYRPARVQMQPDRVHNDYLNTLTDLGAVGGAIVLAALALLGWGFFKTWKAVRGSGADLGGRSGSNRLAFVAGAAAGLAAILFHSFVDFNMHVPANAILAVALMALLSSHLRFGTDRYLYSARPWARAAFTLVLAGGMVYLSHQGWQRAREYRYEVQAEAAPEFSTEKVEALQKAFRIDPRNFATAEMIGESLRVQSLEGGTDTRQLAEQAMVWFQRAMALNPWKPNAFWGYGWCLDWLEQPTEAALYYQKALQLDPQNYEVLNRIGLHHVQNRDFAGARPYFERSLRLLWGNNPTARNYLGLANARLLEAATNDFSARFYAPAKELKPGE